MKDRQTDRQVGERERENEGFYHIRVIEFFFSFLIIICHSSLDNKTVNYDNPAE